MKFEVGNRVKVYGHIPTIGGFSYGAVGTVTKVGPCATKVTVDCGFAQGHIEVHVKQCRKLVKKERRRVWVHERALNHDQPSNYVIANPNSDLLGGGYIEFIEVKKK